MAAPPPPLLLTLSLLPLLALRAPGARAAPPPLPALLLAAAAASAEDYDAVRSSLRELEAQALRAALLQAQAAEQAREGWGEGGGGGEPLPLPLALAGRAPAYGAAPFDLSKEEQPPVKKMKSYMSLCLFKICNMGRKRTNRS